MIHHDPEHFYGGVFPHHPQIEDLTERWSKNCHIDRALYQKYDVKRGLRDANGRGVLASLTRISEVKGYTVDGNDTIPVRACCTTAGTTCASW